MVKVPSKLQLTLHAKNRLRERNNISLEYNEINLVNSPYKWFTPQDLIPQSALYTHSIYVCRKSKNFGYITDGNLEILYNKNSNVVITVMCVKDKFKPIANYIRPEVLKEVIKK